MTATGSPGSSARCGLVLWTAVALLAAGPGAGQTTPEPESPPAAPIVESAADAAQAALALGESPDEDVPEAEATTDDVEPIVGRIVLTTDAPAIVVIDGESLGTLEPGKTFERDMTTLSGKIRVNAADAAGAVINIPYSFEEPEAEDDQGSDESADDADAAADDGDEAGPATPRGKRSVEDGLVVLRFNLRIGKAIRALRKTERQDRIYPIFDDAVMWAREDNRTNVTWKQANAFCADSDLGGYRDWRLPDIDELAALQSMWSRAALKTIDPIRLTDCCPWSSSEVGDDEAWNFDFRFRKKFRNSKGHSFGLRALCVRTMTEAEIAEHEAAVAERAQRKKDEKKRKKLIKKGLLDPDEAAPGDESGAEPPG